jgi:hypothetical protein
MHRAFGGPQSRPHVQSAKAERIASMEDVKLAAAAP